jgi:hypothetical protein
MSACGCTNMSRLRDQHPDASGHLTDRRLVVTRGCPSRSLREGFRCPLDLSPRQPTMQLMQPSLWQAAVGIWLGPLEPFPSPFRVCRSQAQDLGASRPGLAEAEMLLQVPSVAVVSCPFTFSTSNPKSREWPPQGPTHRPSPRKAPPPSPSVPKYRKRLSSRVLPCAGRARLAGALALLLLLFHLCGGKEQQAPPPSCAAPCPPIHAHLIVDFSILPPGSIHVESSLTGVFFSDKRPTISTSSRHPIVSLHLSRQS